MTKGYTLNYFINLVSSARPQQLTTADSVYTYLSPKKGYFSVKGEVFDFWLGHNTHDVVTGNGRFAAYGATPRARLLKALRNRKKIGTI